MRIVFVGNFGVPFSTEAHHKWTWERLGHTVVALQENQTTTDAILHACEGADLFQYTHTHGWVTAGSMYIQEMLDKIHERGVKSFSYHLDYYHGLNTLDRRHDKVGQHPSWKVQHFFSTDGGHEDFYRERGVNHHYLRPGVVEYGCHYGAFRGDLAVDVGFVGSVGYHPEYPWRQRMCEQLRAHYGQRFRIFTGYREKVLNDLYASIKVVVGDHIFAGGPRYWSDRWPETCGRGGFMVYPRTEGACIPSMLYEPQNFADLTNAIDHALDMHPDTRQELRRVAFEHVREHDTYTVLLQEVLKTVGL